MDKSSRSLGSVINNNGINKGKNRRVAAQLDRSANDHKETPF